MDNTPWLKNNGNANVVPEIRFPTAYETETTTQHRTYEHPVSCGQRALVFSRVIPEQRCL